MPFDYGKCYLRWPVGAKWARHTVPSLRSWLSFFVSPRYLKVTLHPVGDILRPRSGFCRMIFFKMIFPARWEDLPCCWIKVQMGKVQG